MINRSELLYISCFMLIHKLSNPHYPKQIDVLCSYLVSRLINTVREMAGHSDERTTYKNYVFDRHSMSEKNNMIENALNHKVDSSGFKVESKWF